MLVVVVEGFGEPSSSSSSSSSSVPSSPSSSASTGCGTWTGGAVETVLRDVEVVAVVVVVDVVAVDVVKEGSFGFGGSATHSNSSKSSMLSTAFCSIALNLK